MSQHAQDVADLRREIVRIVLKELAEPGAEPVAVELAGAGLTALENRLDEKLAPLAGLGTLATHVGELGTSVRDLKTQIETLSGDVRTMQARLAALPERLVGPTSTATPAPTPQGPTPAGAAVTDGAASATAGEPESGHKTRVNLGASRIGAEDDSSKAGDGLWPMLKEKRWILVILALAAAVLALGVIWWTTGGSQDVPSDEWKQSNIAAGPVNDAAGPDVLDAASERELNLQNELDTRGAGQRSRPRNDVAPAESATPPPAGQGR